MPNIVVAVTDYDWFRNLSQRPDLEEVNFWRPSDAPFRALQPGEYLLFKLRADRGGFIVGGGVFAYSCIIPISQVWDTYGEANGADFLAELRDMTAGDRVGDFNICCRILTDPIFFDKADWIDPPDDRPNSPLKKYNTEAIEGRN